MTKSELHAVMSGGFASIAGGVFAAYVSFGVSPSHLLAASFMSAPASLAISKIVYPETEISATAISLDDKEDKSVDASKFIEVAKSEYSNPIEALASGAIGAISLVANIVAMLIAFLAMIAFLDATFAYFGQLINVELSFTIICGYIFFPMAFLMGVVPADCLVAGELIGIKVFANEFVAYLGLLQAKDTLDARSEVVLIYALCGFSNFGAMGIALGGLSGLAPSRTKDLSKLVLSSMICGNIACFMTACIANLLYDE